MDEWAVESGLAPKENSDPADQSSLDGDGLAVIPLTLARSESVRTCAYNLWSCHRVLKA